LNLRHPGEQPPLMPAIARQNTVAGAVAFGRFFVATIDWGYATTSSAYMRHYFNSGCGDCAAIVGFLDTAARQNLHYIGGRLTITDAAPKYPELDPTHSYPVIVTLNIAAVQTVEANGTIRPQDSQPAYAGSQEYVQLAWGKGTWNVIAMTLVNAPK
jgi:hypothetical protein